MRNITRAIYEKIASVIKQETRYDYIPVRNNGFWEPRSYPTLSLRKTANLFNEINGEIIVEIGTGIHGEMSGNSMLVWSQKTAAKRIIAVDLQQERLDEVAAVTRQHSGVELVLADGIEFLSRFTGMIDLLYLDFWVPDPKGTVPGNGRAEGYREAFEAAKDKMNVHSMILIDDTDYIHPWKHTHIVPLAREEGYSVLYTGRQTLLQR